MLRSYSRMGVFSDGMGPIRRRRILLLAGLVALLATGHAAPAPAAKPRLLAGTQLRDYIQGTPGPDRIALRGGDDLGFGRRGRDLLLGGHGHDRLRGGPGRDRLHGGPGRDRLHGGPGVDVLRGGPGADLIDARDRSRDRLVRGGPGNDLCLLDPADVGRARGCERVAVPGDPRAARSYGIWRPGPRDSCPVWLHDAHSVVGPDGKRYPSWHPPGTRNPATGRLCTFGHEHGRNPAGSRLARWVRSHFAGPAASSGPGIPFGLANEALDAYAAIHAGVGRRHEDHVGHKVEWENGVELQRAVGGERVGTGVRCDFLTKLHQGSHSTDAFGNNVHELIYAVRCDDGTALIATVLSPFGSPNSFGRSCDGATVVPAGTAHSFPSGAGARLIPDRACVEEHVLVVEGRPSEYSLGLYENWLSSNSLRSAEGEELARFDPHFAVLNPSRYAAGSPANALARTLDVCFEAEPETGERARGGYCEAAQSFGGKLSWDSPLSGFDGTQREVTFNQTEITNAGGPSRWHTDPYGRGALRKPFPGSICQVVSSGDNRRGLQLEPQTFGSDRDYGVGGVHAPN